MVKKKGGGQEQSKKALQKKKSKIIEDQTFGLKNKNKSKKVQQHIASVEKAVLNGGDRKQRQLEEQRAKAKQEAKARKKALEEERNALFGEALLAIKGSSKSTSQKDGKQEAKGRDADEDTKKPGQSRAMKMMFQMDAQEMEERLKEDPNYIPTLEDEVEAQRQKKVAELKASGKGTPVTAETFAAWQEQKRKRKAEAAKKLVEAEMKKKKGGKGLAVLSGRALYEYKRDLFLDDDNAAEDLEFSDDDDEEFGTPSNSGAVEITDSHGDHPVDDVSQKVEKELSLSDAATVG